MEGEVDTLTLKDRVAHRVAGEEEEEREGEAEAERDLLFVPEEQRVEERVRVLDTVVVDDREVEKVGGVEGEGEKEGVREVLALSVMDPEAEVDPEEDVDGQGDTVGDTDKEVVGQGVVVWEEDTLGEVVAEVERHRVCVGFELGRPTESTVTDPNGEGVRRRGGEPVRKEEGVGESRPLLDPPLGVTDPL